VRLGQRASSNAVVKAVMSQMNGIRESKSKAKLESNIKGQSGHFVSSKAHSIKTIQNVRSVTKQYISYIKSNYGNRVVKYINSATAKEFLLSKDISGASLNTYISSLAKTADNLKILGAGTLTRNDIHNIRKELKETIDMSKNHRDRSYTNKDKIIENVAKSSPYSLSCKLNFEAGLRLSDSIDSSKWRLNNDGTLHIMQSKNGLNYNTMPLSASLYKEVNEAMKNGYKIDRNEYSKVLKEAIELTNQKYNGVHGTRYSFARDRYHELKESFGLSKTESLSILALEMGHSRAEISMWYL